MKTILLVAALLGQRDCLLCQDCQCAKGGVSCGCGPAEDYYYTYHRLKSTTGKVVKVSAKQQPGINAWVCPNDVDGFVAVIPSFRDGRIYTLISNGNGFSVVVDQPKRAKRLVPRTYSRKVCGPNGCRVVTETQWVEE